MFAEVLNSIEALNISEVSQERKQILQPLISYIQSKVDAEQSVNLNFICTHNSRRSHLSQIWAQTFAYYYGISNIFCYSGGTEVTALFPKIAETLFNQGFHIIKISINENPVYGIKYDKNILPIIGFSKVYDSDFNPKLNFAAIMTCTSADEGCPFVSGSDARISIPFQDPKAFDGHELMNEKYLEASILIATELKYVFSKIKDNSI